MSGSTYRPYLRLLGQDPASGRPVVVRRNRYGRVVQIGLITEREEPLTRFLNAGQDAYKITLQEALDLFRLPRLLGQLPTGETVTVNTGAFGPYLKYETTSPGTGQPMTRYVPLTTQDPLTIAIEQAIPLLRAHLRRREFRVIDGGLDESRNHRPGSGGTKSAPEDDSR